MKVALFGTQYLDKISEKAEAQTIEVCKALKNYGAEIYLPDSYFYLLSLAAQNILQPLCFLFGKLPDVDIALSVGGDGTFLRTAASVGDSDIPVLGINTGRLGFLADVNFNHLADTLAEIFEKNYTIEERELLQICANDGDDYTMEREIALNEVAILKQDTASMLTIHTYINDDFLTTYEADGLIVATPTGSTAYALSVGGPIMVPQSPSFVLAPIAPHNLTSRPLVVHNDVKIKLHVESRSNNFLVSLDGHSKVFHTHAHIDICRAPYTLKVVKRTGHTFYETLRDKLLWGVDVRK